MRVSGGSTRTAVCVIDARDELQRDTVQNQPWSRARCRRPRVRTHVRIVEHIF